MKNFLIVIVILSLHFTALSQKVHVITINELNDRIYRAKDTIFIINFWAVSCAPCVKELPYFEKLNDQFKKKKLKVLLINVDLKSKLNSSVILFKKKKK